MLESCVSINRRNLFIILSGFLARSPLVGRIARPSRDARALDHGRVPGAQVQHQAEMCDSIRWPTVTETSQPGTPHADRGGHPTR
jgi:hypothetical protein